MKRVLGIMVAVVASCLLSGFTHAADWGNLSGQFIYDGQPPTPPLVKITKDKECCGKLNVVDESLVVNAETKGIANVILYLYPSTTSSGSLSAKAAQIPIHPSYQETEKAEIKLDNFKCRFDPHVVLLRTTQSLVVGNSDPIGHNTKIDTFKNDPINYTIPSGGTLKHQFPNAERMPSRVSCSIHPWMIGWVLIRDNPYMAVTDKDGKFSIKNLPVGTWEFMFWHEKAGYVDQVTLGGSKQEWKKGRAKFVIKSGNNDLGVIKVSPQVFEKK